MIIAEISVCCNFDQNNKENPLACLITNKSKYKQKEKKRKQNIQQNIHAKL